MKNLLKMCFLVFVVSTLLTGCMYVDMGMNISSDGRVTLVSTSGFTEAGMEMLKSFVGEDDESLNDYETIVENGNTYYVQRESQEFDISEFDKIVNGESEDGEEVSTVDTGKTELYQNADGSVVFKLVATQDTADTDSIQDQLKGDEMGLSDEEAAALMKDMVARWSITFPNTVTQTSGSKDGITINGNKLTIDLMSLRKLQEGETEEYIFVSAPLNGNTVKEDKFSDVPSTAWYYNAVNALADGGLVSGMGNGIFAPSNELTIGQFCSILSKAKGLELGELNGHWAGKAVQNCIDAGYVLPNVEVNNSYYNRAITREEAVSAMYLAKANELTEVVDEEADFPDYAQVSPEYRTSIVGAYMYGITSGMDEAHTFAPKSILTRAQICQLFYNLNWTTAE